MEWGGNAFHAAGDKSQAGSHNQFSRNALVSVSPTGKQYLHFASRTDPQEQGHKRILHNNFFQEVGEIPKFT